jgi:uncharacterized protein (DUF1778 family)
MTTRDMTTKGKARPASAQDSGDDGVVALTQLPGERRSERLDLRVTPSEAAFIRQAAASRRQSVTEFLTEAAVAAAARAVQEDRRVVLMNEVFDRLVAELDEPAKVVPALAALLKRPRQVELPDLDAL